MLRQLKIKAIHDRFRLTDDGLLVWDEYDGPGAERQLSKISEAGYAEARAEIVAIKFEREGYYVKAGVLYNSLDRVAMRDVCEYYGHPFDAVQESMYDAYLDKALSDYREAQANRSSEEIAEQRFEAMAAFGPGQQVVNVITGESYTT